MPPRCDERIFRCAEELGCDERSYRSVSDARTLGFKDVSAALMNDRTNVSDTSSTSNRDFRDGIRDLLPRLIIGLLSTLCLTLCNSLQHSARYFRQTLATSVFRLRCHYNCAPCSVNFVRKNIDFVLRVMINTLSSRSFQKHRHA